MEAIGGDCSTVIVAAEGGKPRIRQGCRARLFRARIDPVSGRTGCPCARA